MSAAPRPIAISDKLPSDQGQACKFCPLEGRSATAFYTWWLTYSDGRESMQYACNACAHREFARHAQVVRFATRST